jgi:hypothetical protein
MKRILILLLLISLIPLGFYIILLTKKITIISWFMIMIGGLTLGTLIGKGILK